MAICIKECSLSSDTSQLIYKHLNIYPKQYTKRNITPKAIRSYVSTQIDGDPYVCLPFHYGRGLFKVNNDYRHHYRTQVSISDKVVLKPLQVEVISKTIDVINTNRACIIKRRPGAGKTLMGLYLAGHLKLKTIILLSKVDHTKQWRKESIKVLGESTRVFCPKDKSLSNCSEDDADIIICYHDRHKLLKQSTKDSIALVIVDECHNICNKTFIASVLAFQPMCLIGCSATPSRSRDGLDDILTAFFGKHHIDVEEDINANIVIINTGFVGDRQYDYDGMLKWHDLNKSLIYNQERNENIVHICKHLVHLGRKIMIITNEVDHVKQLSHMININGMSSDYLCENKSNYVDCQVLVGNIQKCGEGFDQMNALDTDEEVQPIDTLILASSQANKEDREQTDGRVLRYDNPLIVHLRDNDDTIKKHIKLALKIYKTKPSYTVNDCNWETFYDTIKQQ